MLQRNEKEKEIKLHRRFLSSYKKNTLAIFFSFALTFLLLTSMLTLMHTNHRIANIQSKMEFTPSDCYIKGVSEEQLDLLREDPDIGHLAVEEVGYKQYQRNQQSVFLTKMDGEAITMTAKVFEGRLPEKEGEVAAEKWALLNLGVEPVVGQVFTIRSWDTGELYEVKLTGLLTDMYQNKKYGTINLYTSLNPQTADRYVAYLQLKSGVDYNQTMERLKSELGVQEKQIKESPARENFCELYVDDAKVVGVILLICMVVFYGVYRIAALTREPQYGILRAVGMKKKQLRKMILLELYQIYCVSVPIGIGLGVLVAYLIMFLSGDQNMEVYLYHEKVHLVPVIPVSQILICVILAALLVGMVGYAAGCKVLRAPIVETISGASLRGKGRGSLFELRPFGSKMGTLVRMGCKYIVRDLKTSSFVVLTICLGITLFTGLAYQVQLAATYREDTKEMWYLNGQYAMTMLSFDRVDEGLSRESVKEIRELEDVISVKTTAGMPIRVIDEDSVARNDAYYDEINAKLREFYGYDDTGFDGKNQIYKSNLYGYNMEGLKALEKYVISGNFDPQHLAEDEIILCVLRTDDTKENDFPGSFREGTPLMDYEVGDEIRVKYPAGFQTDTEAYEKLTDVDTEYRYRTYKVAAVVAFNYMYDCNRTVYPLLITSDQQLQNIAPESHIQCMYVDAKSDLSSAEQIALEQRLIQICNQNSYVSTRSLISEIEQNEMFYHKQMVYVYGIALVAFILVMINMINNLRYRMRTRTREISMLRAIGMSMAMTRRMLLFENLILGCVGAAAAYLLSQPVLRYLYVLSDMKAFGHSFVFNDLVFAAVSGTALVICALLSVGIMKSWKNKRIVEGIGSLE